MRLRDLFSPCVLGHAEPMKTVRGKELRFECSRCQKDLGPVLAGQQFKARRTKKARQVKFKEAARVIGGRFQ